jgi:hypothetical protein
VRKCVLVFSVIGSCAGLGYCMNAKASPVLGAMAGACIAVLLLSLIVALIEAARALEKAEGGK